MIDIIIARLIMFLCHIEYKKIKNDYLCIEGTGEHYPRYLLYTEKEDLCKRMENLTIKKR